MADGYNFDKKTSLGDTMNSLLSRQDALIRQKQKQGKLGTMEKVMGLLGILSIVDGIQTKSASIKTRNALTSPEMIAAQAKADFLKMAPQSQLVVDYGSYYNPNDKQGSINAITRAYIGKADPSIFAGTGFDPNKFSFEDLSDDSQTMLLDKFTPTATSIYNSIDSTDGQALLEPYKAGRQERQRQLVSYEENRNNFIDRLTNKITGNQSLFKDRTVADDFLKGKLIYNEDKSALIDNPNWVEGGVEFPGDKFVKPNRIGAIPDLSDVKLEYKPKQEITTVKKEYTAKFDENGILKGYVQNFNRVVKKDIRGNEIESTWVPEGEPVENYEATENARKTQQAFIDSYPNSAQFIQNQTNMTLNEAIDQLIRNEKPYSSSAYTNLKQFDDEVQQLYNLKTNAQRLNSIFNQVEGEDVPRVEYIDPEIIGALGGDLESYTRANLETFKRFEYQKAWKEGRLTDSVKGLNQDIKDSYGLTTNDKNQPVISEDKDVTLVKPSLTRVKTLGDGTPIVINGKEQFEAILMPEQLKAFSELGEGDQHIVDMYFRKVTNQTPVDGDVFPANYKELNVTPWTWNDDLKQWLPF